MTAAWPVADEFGPDWSASVAGFLRANPSWLAEHPELYRALTPPTRIHGETLADHMAAMVLRERRHAATVAEQNQALVAAKRAVATGLARIHDAVLALITTRDLSDYIGCELPRLLNVDVACLWEPSTQPSRMLRRLEAVLGCRDVVFRIAPNDAPELYREAAALALHDALIRVPGAGVLGLASRDPLRMDPAETQLGLHFLGRAIARFLQR